MQSFILVTTFVHTHAGLNLDVSSSSRPWIDAFALPGKFNMAVTENDLDPKHRKISITF